jgi:hypothetical protein
MEEISPQAWKARRGKKENISPSLPYSLLIDRVAVHFAVKFHLHFFAVFFPIYG